MMFDEEVEAVAVVLSLTGPVVLVGQDLARVSLTSYRMDVS